MQTFRYKTFDGRMYEVSWNREPTALPQINKWLERVIEKGEEDERVNVRSIQRQDKKMV